MSGTSVVDDVIDEIVAAMKLLPRQPGLIPPAPGGGPSVAEGANYLRAAKSEVLHARADCPGLKFAHGWRLNSVRPGQLPPYTATGKPTRWRLCAYCSTGGHLAVNAPAPEFADALAPPRLRVRTGGYRA